MAWTQGYKYDMPGVVRTGGGKNGVSVKEKEGEAGSQGSRTVESGTSDGISVKRNSGMF